MSFIKFYKIYFLFNYILIKIITHTETTNKIREEKIIFFHNFFNSCKKDSQKNSLFYYQQSSLNKKQ